MILRQNQRDQPLHEPEGVCSSDIGSNAKSMVAHFFIETPLFVIHRFPNELRIAGIAVVKRSGKNSTVS